MNMQPKFEINKHKTNLRLGNVKRMIDNRGTPVIGAFGVSGIAVDVNGEMLGADKIICEAGHGFPLHTHPGHHLLYVLKGRGILHINGRNFKMARGDLFYVPAEYPHAMRGGRKQRLVVLAVGFPHKEVDAIDRMTLVQEAKP